MKRATQRLCEDWEEEADLDAIHQRATNKRKRTQSNMRKSQKKRDRELLGAIQTLGL